MNSKFRIIYDLIHRDKLYMNDIYSPKRVCKTCVMDDSDREIVFTATGCNHCDTAKLNVSNHYKFISSKKKEFFSYLDDMKRKSQNCIVGLSGGVDSSHLVIKLKEYGLNPVSVHLDNHWNSPLASDNIYKLVTKLDLNFKTIVLDWEDFKKQQLALIYANVIDLENATDHAIFSTLFREARLMNNATIFHGVNITSENIMPMSWIHRKHDAANLRHIFNTFFPNERRNFPFLSTMGVIYNRRVLGIKWNAALDFFDYDKTKAEANLVKDFNFIVPKRKHEESLITKIYQRIILPLKFNVDKRKAHYSSLVASGQITRDQAFSSIEQPLYERRELINDLNIFLNKLDLTEEEFYFYLSSSARSHFEFRNDKIVTDLIYLINRIKK